VKKTIELVKINIEFYQRITFGHTLRSGETWWDQDLSAHTHWQTGWLAVERGMLGNGAECLRK